MKKHIWADPAKEWEGLRFTAYTLNWEKLRASGPGQRWYRMLGATFGNSILLMKVVEKR